MFPQYRNRALQPSATQHEREMATAWPQERSRTAIVQQPAGGVNLDGTPPDRRLETIEEVYEDIISMPPWDEDRMALEGASPDYAKRKCTDVHGLVMLALYLSGMAILFAYTERKGATIWSIRTLVDHNGTNCGMANNVGKYLLAYTDKVIDINTTSSSNTWNAYVLPETKNAIGFCVTECPRSTTAWNALLCIPDSIYHDIRHFGFSFIGGRENKIYLSAAANSLARAWESIVASIVLSVAVSYLYLFFLKLMAGLVLTVAFALLQVIFLLYAIYLLLITWRHYNWVGGSGDWWINGFVAVSSLILFFIFRCFAQNQKKAVKMVAFLINVSCEVCYDVPTLILEPLLCLLAYLAVVLYLARCALKILLISEFADYSSITLGQWVALSALAIAAFFVNDFIRSYSEFVIAYTTQLWFFKGRHPARSLAFCQVHLKALRYHVGSFAIGSVVIGATRLPRTILSIIGGTAQVEGWALSGLVRQWCCCIISLFDSIAPYNKGAYMDMAIHGASFFQSANHTQMILMEKPARVHILNAATFVFQLLGVGLICVLSYSQTMLLVETGIVGEHLSYDWKVVPAVFNASLSYLVSLPFLMLFDSVSDTVMFCVSLHEQRVGHSIEDRGQNLVENPIVAPIAAPFIFAAELIGCAGPRRHGQEANTFAGMDDVHKIYGVNQRAYQVFPRGQVDWDRMPVDANCKEFIRGMDTVPMARDSSSSGVESSDSDGSGA